jgi:hypothetical protein
MKSSGSVREARTVNLLRRRGLRDAEREHARGAVQVLVQADQRGQGLDDGGIDVPLAHRALKLRVLGLEFGEESADLRLLREIKGNLGAAGLAGDHDGRQLGVRDPTLGRDRHRRQG